MTERKINISESAASTFLREGEGRDDLEMLRKLIVWITKVQDNHLLLFLLK